MKKIIIFLVLIIIVVSSFLLNKNDKNITYNNKWNFIEISDNNKLYYNIDYDVHNFNLENEINKLEYVSTIKDGGSKLYKDKDDKYYLLNCNTVDGIKDVYISNNVNELDGICNIHMNMIDEISLEIEKDSLTNSSLKLIITDSSKEKNYYGEWFRIDEFVNNEWNEVYHESELAFNMMAYVVDENNKLTFNVNWENIYGKLPNGKYRLVKSVTVPDSKIKNYVSIEFIV